jgi:hypothetical protein
MAETTRHVSGAFQAGVRLVKAKLTTPMSTLVTRTAPFSPGGVSRIPCPRSNSQAIAVSRPHSSPISTLAPYSWL